MTFKRLTSIGLVSLLLALTACGGGSENESSNESENNELTDSVQSDIDDGIESPNQIVENLDNEKFSTYLNEREGILIDVRTAEEYNEGHIEGAINSDFLSGEFEKMVDTLSKTKAVFVYCQAGGRSGKARDILVEKEFQEVYNLESGYGNWNQ